jgi:hypothetical protein
MDVFLKKHCITHGKSIDNNDRLNQMPKKGDVNESRK